MDGKSYYFKKREEFEDLINKNEFLEFAEYAGEYYGTLKKDVYKNYFKGKNVIIEIDSQGARQIREKQKIQSVFLIPPSFEELLHRLKNRGTESKESIHRRLKQALDEIEHIEEYGVLLVNDSVEGTVFVIDALFHPGLKNASGMNERELKIASLYMIRSYRTQIWRGGEVYYEPEFQNIVFAKDGEIYDFDGKKAIVIGGAYSRDKEYRILTGLPWFPDEQPDDKVKSQVENKLNEVACK